MIYFKLKNFKVFNEEAIFETVPYKLQTKNKDIYIEKKYLNKKVELLPYSVIYGANASGKSTLVKAMAILKEIVLSGKIVSSDEKSLLFDIGLLPYLHSYDKYCEPVGLGIGFIQNNKKYEYSIAFKCSLSPVEQYCVEKEIVEETLTINNKIIFNRNNISIKYRSDKNMIIGSNIAIDKSDLFLHSTFKNNIKDNEDYLSFINWFKEKFIVITDLNSLKLQVSLNEFPKFNRINIKNEIIDAAQKIADFGPQQILYRIDANHESQNLGLQMRSIYKIKGLPPEKSIDTNSINTESAGTIKFVNILTVLFPAIISGSTIVIDELDSSFHFEIIKEILNVFLNKNINSKGAQLIFTSHNPIFMSLIKIRKDQVYFVNKNLNNFTSELYSLSDFKSYGKKSVRNGETFVKNYLEGKYGALPKFDFEKSLQKYLEKMKEMANEKK